MPRYEGPENLFYYEQEDDMFAIQKRRSTWNYNIVRPMAIIGYSCQCRSKYRVRSNQTLTDDIQTSASTKHFR
jgi:hypothetical protein